MNVDNNGGKKREGKSKAGQTAWDPASAPAESASLQEEEERQFHATHFTADPRGAGMSGAPPAARRKKRGGTPPETPDRDTQPPPARPKRRGGAGPE